MLKIRQVMTFAGVGMVAALVHIAAAILLIEQGAVTPWLANILAFFLALPISYLGHARLTFARQRSASHDTLSGTSLRRFAILAGVGFTLNEASIVLFVERVGLPHRPVLAATAFGVAALVYLTSKFWAFAGPPTPPKPA